MEKTPKTIDRKDYSFVSDEIKKKTGVYPMMDVQFCPQNFQKVPDLSTGGQRNKRYAAVVSIVCVPNYENQEAPLVLQGHSPAMLVDADSIEDLEKRIASEIKGTLKLYQDVADGVVVPPTYEEMVNAKATTEKDIS